MINHTVKGEIATTLTIITLTILTIGIFAGSKLSQTSTENKIAAQNGCPLNGNPQLLAGGICSIATEPSRSLVCALIDPSKPAGSQEVAGQVTSNINWVIKNGSGTVPLKKPYSPISSNKTYRLVVYQLETTYWHDVSPQGCIKTTDIQGSYVAEAFQKTPSSSNPPSQNTLPPPVSSATNTPTPTKTTAQCPNATPIDISFVKSGNKVGCKLSTNPPKSPRMNCTLIDKNIPPENNQQVVVKSKFDNTFTETLFFIFSPIEGKIRPNGNFAIVGYDQDDTSDTKNCVIEKTISKDTVFKYFNIPLHTPTPQPSLTQTPSPTPTPFTTTVGFCNYDKETDCLKNCSNGTCTTTDNQCYSCVSPTPTPTPTPTPLTNRNGSIIATSSCGTEVDIVTDNNSQFAKFTIGESTYMIPITTLQNRQNVIQNIINIDCLQRKNKLIQIFKLLQ